MKFAALLALFATLALAQNDRPKIYTVTAVRTWSLADATRVAIEVSGPFEYKYDRVHDPERVYFDIKGALPAIEGRRIWNQEVTDRLVQRIRVAETNPAVTRVVLHVSGPVEVSASHLSNPNRLMIELRPGVGLKDPARTSVEAPVVKPATPPAAAEIPRVVESKPKPPVEPVMDRPPVVAEPSREQLASQRAVGPPAPERQKKPGSPLPRESASVQVSEPPGKAPLPLVRESGAAAAPSELVKPTLKTDAPIHPAELANAARTTSGGTSSLTRALGLKLNRIVLDAGHGGHDQGTSGPKGLLEKELVLDVTLRLGKLIEQGMGAEVIYTRQDDTFIPLEGRTQIANEKKSDLFLSIHANASSYARVTGVESYYLNFTDSKEAMDLAGRENATAQHSIFDLETLTHKIALHEKLDESREFAGRVQSALFAFSVRSFPGQKNRGVRKAPFVVLIGATMPSVLVEIGFVSNPREEQLLKKPDYRQKLAESLYKGVSKYAEGLSHFQLAQGR